MHYFQVAATSVLQCGAARYQAPKTTFVETTIGICSLTKTEIVKI